MKTGTLIGARTGKTIVRAIVILDHQSGIVIKKENSNQKSVITNKQVAWINRG